MKKRILIIVLLIILVTFLMFLQYNPKVAGLGPVVQMQSWGINTIASSSGDVAVQSSDGATMTTSVIHAPYGVRSEVITVNGKTYSTTTPLTEDDVKQMQKQQQDMQDRIDKIFEEQQKMFQDMWKNFPY